MVHFAAAEPERVTETRRGSTEQIRGTRLASSRAMPISSPLLAWSEVLTPKDALGYASSLLLVVTIGYQIHRQWKTGTSKGVSVWLFVGQLFASLGFTAYSVLVDDFVFVVTNATLACAAVAGLTIVTVHRRRESRARGRGREEVVRDVLARPDIDVERVVHDVERSLVARSGDRG